MISLSAAPVACKHRESCDALRVLVPEWRHALRSDSTGGFENKKRESSRKRKKGEVSTKRKKKKKKEFSRIKSVWGML